MWWELTKLNFLTMKLPMFARHSPERDAGNRCRFGYGLPGKAIWPNAEFLAIADYITKLHAICVVCGNIANVSYRKVNTGGQVLLGEKDIYEPRCRVCAALKS